MNKLKHWVKENKDELLFGWSTFATLLGVMGIVFGAIMVSVTNDLVGVVQTKEKEIVELNNEIAIWQYQANYYSTLADEVIQTYEDSVPKQQYIQDVEYLESVILELRYQCELQCGTYNNKEN